MTDEIGNISVSLWNVLLRGLLVGRLIVCVNTDAVLMCSASRLKMAAACIPAVGPWPSSTSCR